MKKILIIDDDTVFAQTVQDALIDEPYEILRAADGEEGVRMFNERSPDLILLDIVMPKMDGIEFLKTINASGRPNTPVLITSNLADAEKVSEGISLGVRGYILKSDQSLDSIVENIKQVLSE